MKQSFVCYRSKQYQQPRKNALHKRILFILLATTTKASITAATNFLQSFESVGLSIVRGGGGGEKMSTEQEDVGTTEERKRSKSYEKSSNADSTITIGGGAINEKKRMYSIGENKRLDDKQKMANIIVDTTEKNDGGNNDETETSSNYDPTNTLSHLLHTFAGLDRYPNYLNRWSFDDMNKLEDALEEKLRQVRQQKKSIEERRESISCLVRRAAEILSENGDGGDIFSILTPPKSWEEVQNNNILDSRASDAIFKSKFFKGGRLKASPPPPPAVDDVLSGKCHVQLDMALLERWIDQEMFDVYSFPLFSEKFCTKLRNLIRTVVKLGEEEEFIHLNLGRRPVDLDTIGMGWVNDLLFHLVIRPISNHLFKDTESMEDLDWRQGYIAGYSVKPQAETGTPRHQLVSHTDDSEVTLNICIGDVFEGGAVRFYGLRGTEDEGNLVGEFEPILGTAIIHAGRHLHEVTRVESGNRYAYILWSRSWKGSRDQTCPCCWLNRRQGDMCICGKRWN